MTPVQLKYDINTVMARERYCPPKYLTSDKRIMRDRDKVVAYARKALMNNPLYQRLITLVADYILGADGAELLLDAPGIDDGRKRQLARQWREWCRNCDARGEMSFTNLEREIVREVLNVGEVLVIINEDKTLSIVQTENVLGVDTDARGKATGYHYQTIVDNEKVPAFIPAERAVFLYNKPEPNATRGIGYFWSAFVYLFYVDNILKAASKAAAEASKWVAVLTSNAAATPYIAPADPGAEAPTVESDLAARYGEFDAGMFFRMQPGEDARILNNPKPETGLEEGLRPYLKMITACTGVPVDLALADYANQSYSSSKALSLHLRWSMGALATDLIHKFYRKIFRKCVAAVEVDFCLPRMQTIDEYKEAQADAMRVNSGLATLTQTLKERNIDFDELQAARKAELLKMWETAEEVSRGTGGKIAPEAVYAALTGIKGEGNAKRLPEA